jgi:hypothetical protein
LLPLIGTYILIIGNTEGAINVNYTTEFSDSKAAGIGHPDSEAFNGGSPGLVQEQVPDR